jgi:ABC-type sugar transport system ATPase subunit
MRLADRIAVLNEGHLIAEGDAHHVSQDRLVREAYLGRRAEEEEEEEEQEKHEKQETERQATPGSLPAS